MKKNLPRVSLTALLTLVMLMGGVAPRAAHAADIDSPLQLAQQTFTHILSSNINVSSLANSIASKALVTKAYLLDPAAWIASQISLQAVVQSTLNWVGSGFNGSPSFVTDLNQRLRTVGDTAALSFINQLATNGSINSPLQSVVAQAVRTTYLRNTGSNGFFDNNQFTLGQASQNPNAFLKGDFTQGGFNAWFLANEPKNNALGQYQNALNAVNSSAQGAQDTEKTQLAWANGTKSYKGTACAKQSTAGTGTLSLDSIDPCIFSNIVTPGSTIINLSNKAGIAGLDKLISAKQLDEVASSFLTNILLNTLKNGPSNSAVSASQSSGTAASNTGTNALGASASTDPTTAITNIVANQVAAVTAYQKNWQVLQAAASAAACSSDPLVQSTLASASTALGKAAAALTALQKVQRDVAALSSFAPGTDADAYLNVIAEYNDLYTSQPPILPDDSEILNAANQSQTGSVDGSPTTLSQLQTLAASCGSGQL